MPTTVFDTITSWNVTGITSVDAIYLRADLMAEVSFGDYLYDSSEGVIKYKECKPLCYPMCKKCLKNIRETGL